MAGRTRSSCAILPVKRKRAIVRVTRPLEDLPMQNAAILDSIYRYPVKGLSPEPYQRVLLRTGQTLPNDRRYAIENGPSDFDPAAPKWLPKAYFLMLMRNERLAALQTHYDDDTSVLTICHDGRDAVQGNLETEQGRAAIERYLRDYCGQRAQGFGEGPERTTSQLFRRREESRLDHQPVERFGDRRPARATSRSVAVSREPLCPTVAGLVRVRSPRQGDRHRRRKAPDHEADRALCRYQR